LIIFAIILLISERVGKKEKGIDVINMRDAILIGLAQAFALIPGASRSGVTICMALLLGYRRDVSARFSFLLSIPSVLGAGLLEMKEVWGEAANFNITSVVIATIFSFIFGILSIEFLLRYLVNHRVNLFAYYRIALGIFIFLFFV
ncbi:MAG: undecaprenyl-diphosphate phosphatase, partial [Myxococcota bacterium]